MKLRKIVPRLLLLFTVCLQSTLIFAQEVDRLPGELWREQYHYYEGLQEVGRDTFEARLAQHPQAAPIFRSADDLTTFGTISLVLGGSALLVGISMASDRGSINLFPEVNSGAVSLFGIGGSITGVVLIGLGKQKLKRSIDVYNKAEFGIDRLSWQIGPNGMGIRLLIGR